MVEAQWDSIYSIFPKIREWTRSQIRWKFVIELTTHNNQIKKDAVCYTPACEWPAAILSQASASKTAPIITGVMCLETITFNAIRSMELQFNE